MIELNRRADLRIHSGFISAAVAVALVSLWELAAQTGAMSPLLAPAPSAVVETLFRLVGSGEIGPHVVATLSRVVLGLIVGGSFGIALGILMGTMPRLRAVIDPFISAFHPLPKIAILPVVMTVLGLGDTSRVAVISIAAFFPMLINTLGGVTQISRTRLDVARNYGASGWKLFTRVMLPASLPMMFAGFRIALNLALL